MRAGQSKIKELFWTQAKHRAHLQNVAGIRCLGVTHVGVKNDAQTFDTNLIS